MLCLQQQGALLQQIAQRLDISNQPVYPAVVQPGYGPSFGWGGDGPSGGMGVLNSQLSNSISHLPQPPSTANAMQMIHQKLSLTSSGPSSDPGQSSHTVVLPVPESVSVYANVNLEGVDRWRKRSIRPTRTNLDGVGRPRSFV